MDIKCTQIKKFINCLKLYLDLSNYALNVRNCISNTDNTGASFRNGLIGIGPKENEIA